MVSLLCGASMSAQVAEQGERVPVGNGWFLQMGLDMSLQNPYGCDFSKTFPNGKTFGIDVALGKWMTPAVGVRGKVNWENGIGLFRNDHANWLAPFYQPGKNMDEGGYVGVTGDVLLNLHNVFGTYRSDRFWNSSVYPRMGLAFNFGSTKGSTLLGGGWLNTFQVNNRWSLYLDMAYNFTCHGFVGKEAKDNGTGTNSNGFFTVGVGTIMNLGKSDKGISRADAGLGEDWFLQAAFDMNLMNPHGSNFSNVFPKGKTFGIDLAVGKEITPELTLRTRLNWANGLFKNGHLEWVAPKNHPEDNFKDGGFWTLNMDVMFNLKNIVNPAHEDDKWHTLAYMRGGLLTHRTLKSLSPVIGIGLEQTYRLNEKLSLYADLGYQVSTKEGSGFGAGFDSKTGSSGFCDVAVGVKVDL